MATYVADTSEEFGRSLAQSKLETKVRADFELQGPVRDWILVVRPFQKIVAEHAEILVQQGVMSNEESVHWLNMHWELICSSAAKVSGGCAIAAFGRERQTRVVVTIKRESLTGYERIRLKAETFLLPRSGAGADETDLDDLSIAGVSARRAGRNEEVTSPDAASEAPAPDLDLEDFPFGNIEVDDGPGDRSKREWDVGEVWVRVDFDDEYYENICEFMGVLKEQKQLEHLQMAEEASQIAAGREVSSEPDEDDVAQYSPGEQFGMAGAFRLKAKKQGVHQPGAKNFVKGRSELEHPNPQSLIDQYAGTGDPKQIHKNGFVQREVVDCRKVIGFYFEQGSTLPKPTTRFMIHYSPKNNQAHIVPARPRQEDEED